MAFIGEMFGFSSPKVPEMEPLPKAPDIGAIESKRRQTYANMGQASRIFTSPLGDTSSPITKASLLGE